VVRDHDQSTSWSQHPQGDVQALGECTELVVDGNSESLEGAPGGMAGAPGPSRHRICDHCGQLRRVRDRAGGDDSVRDPTGVTLLAEAAEGTCETVAVPGIDDRPGVERRVWPHPHVEGTGFVIGEASLPHVELMG